MCSAKEKVEKKNEVNLKKCTYVQLKELIVRQEKILSNKKFINSLPDKGEKIQTFCCKIRLELESRDDVTTTSMQLSKLDISSHPNELEWKKNTLSDHQAASDDSDDEPNPLKILASHSGTQRSYQRKEQSELPSLVTKADIEEAQSFKKMSYAQKLCHKFDQRQSSDRFKPNMPKQKELAHSGYRSSSENVQKLMGKNWEVTSATPPVPIHGSAETISLTASLSLQQQQVQKLKEIQLEEATARLRATATPSIGLLPSNLMAYRKPADPTEWFNGTPSRERHDEFVEEDDVADSGGAIFYNIVDDIPEKS